MSLENFRTQAGRYYGKAETIWNHRREAMTMLFPQPYKLRQINWYLTHNCNLHCETCKAREVKGVKPMDPDQRKEGLRRLAKLSVPGAFLSVIGGEPTFDPDTAVDAVRDATDAGFYVSMVSNMFKLDENLIDRLQEAGLKYLNISVDTTHDKDKLPEMKEKAYRLLGYARSKGIIPVINTVFTRDTDIAEFLDFAREVTDQDHGFFINPIICSPAVPGGIFSGSKPEEVPTQEQINTIVPEMIRIKKETGLVAASANYFRVLQQLHKLKDRMWRCSKHFRGILGVLFGGRGFAAFGANGAIGVCEEHVYGNNVNILDLDESQLSLRYLEGRFAETVRTCPGCLIGCYMTEEGTKGLRAVTDERMSAMRIAEVEAIPRNNTM